MRVFRSVAALFLLLLVPALRAQTSGPVPEKPWEIRAVVIATFEFGADTGDKPGEFQLWVEREHLDEVVPFPGGVHPLRTNKAHTVLGMICGTTIGPAAVSMTALGLDPRFDLSHAYFLINGIAGVDPKAGSLGSAAWARFVIGDVTRMIDPRETPKDWPYGLFPISATEPNKPLGNPPAWFRSNLYPLNPGLEGWAFAMTRDLKLPDDEDSAKLRALYTGDAYKEARRPPFVFEGESFASDYFWHGNIMNQFAEDWVRQWTNGKGNFAMTDMEDSGLLEALRRLDGMKRVDANRVLVLRTASNYSAPPPGGTALDSLLKPHFGKIAFETAYDTGAPVLHSLVDHWANTRDQIPSVK
ncbi:purine nucleoside permease [Granulicella cerasi]|uniref:Purine nucleoside permease n=1 Tax=Granulicella cerasi TaxID=741063 RepID=A0ABW1Z8C3_9BACT|nr:purine nucleoside permease [Granulicella cerasi]